MKAIALDIDGTITNKYRYLCLDAVKELRKAIDKGIELILCTGNIACFARSTAILIGTDAPVIAENGGVIEIKDGEEIVLSEEGKEEAERAFEYLKKEFNVTRFHEDRKTEIVLKNDLPISEISDSLDDFEVDVIDTGFAIHIKSKKTDKAVALKKVTDYLDFSMNEVLGIGDSINDVGLVRESGVGVAVQNSPRVLKDAADYVTEKEFGEGVIEALGKYLDNE